ncbi:hypothetical protein CYLTODRAFT_474818 [Cylindrobasidium torrendii FP15055 ss-10]|uniref:Uncharacterized protein n=1 Tax=Cylindrobasidium torrendii FP15055 ss-10 TaxID=1314674 RepID=A0A0D7AVV4_9AGAR|nr:hypothetical protein CYLTODRAFT_474818 [Cylindrobasidium torrendii FP15055 ss-10]
MARLTRRARARCVSLSAYPAFSTPMKKQARAKTRSAIHHRHHINLAEDSLAGIDRVRKPFDSGLDNSCKGKGKKTLMRSLRGARRARRPCAVVLCQAGWTRPNASPRHPRQSPPHCTAPLASPL